MVVQHCPAFFIFVAHINYGILFSEKKASKVNMSAWTAYHKGDYSHKYLHDSKVHSLIQI